MRVVLLGEYRAERLASPLKQAGAEVIVLGFVDLRSYLECDIVCGKLPHDLSEHALLSLLRAYDADVAIPNITPPGQEQMLPTYARVAPHWQANGGNLLVHSEGFATLATDKVSFHQVAEQRCWPVPRGIIASSPGALFAAVHEIELPVMIKEARSEPHVGRHFVRDRGSLYQISLEIRYPALVQQVITGEEFGVELLAESSHTIAWPVASLAALDSNCTPGKRARVEPARLSDRVQEALAAVVRDIIEVYPPAGPWQIDFAVSNGQMYLIELNGRFGGLSNMSWASTYLDPHVAHVDTVRGRPLRRPQAAQVALELPVYNEAELPPPPAGLKLRPFVGTPTNRWPLRSGYYRAVLGVPDGCEEDARNWLLHLQPGMLLVDAQEAVAQLACGIQALRQGDAHTFANALLPRDR